MSGAVCWRCATVMEPSMINAGDHLCAILCQGALCRGGLALAAHESTEGFN